MQQSMQISNNQNMLTHSCINKCNYTMSKQIKKLVSFYESFLLMIQTTLNMLISKHVDVKQTLNEKTFDVLSIVSKNVLIDSIKQISYKLNNDKIVHIDCTNESEKNTFIKSLKKIQSEKTFEITITFFCFVPIKNPITVYSESMKKNIEISKHVPYIITFYKSINDSKTILQNYLFRTYINYNAMSIDEKKHASNLIHRFLQYFFLTISDLNHSFYVLSNQTLHESYKQN